MAIEDVPGIGIEYPPSGVQSAAENVSPVSLEYISMTELILSYTTLIARLIFSG